MPIPVIRHALDRTGVNPANLVSDEEHPLITGENNIIVPKFGYFYKESVVLTYVADNTPVPRAAYRFTEFFQEASLKYGKEICGSILIEDKTVVGPVTITYQALGGDNSRSTGNLIDVYYDKLQDMPAINWEDLYERPTQFKPKPGHQFNANEIYDWGRVITYVDSIREAIITTNMPAYGALMVYVEKILAKIEALSKKYLDDHMQEVIDAFKAQFTKEYLGLDKLVNMACATDREGFLAGTQARKQTDITENKYMTPLLRILMLQGLRHLLHQILVQWLRLLVLGVGPSLLYTLNQVVQHMLRPIVMIQMGLATRESQALLVLGI